MYKILVAIAIIFSISPKTHGQYDDKFEDKLKSDTSVKVKNNSELKDRLVPGAGLMLTLNQGQFFFETTPFVGYKLAEPVMVGVGLKTSVLAVQGIQKPFGVHGAQMFAQVTLAQQFILYGEYGIINGVYELGPNGSRVRRWVGSPIAGIGFMNGSNSYYMLGYAFSKDYAEINPFGPLVYRMVFYF